MGLTKWDVVKMTYFLTILAMCGALVAIGKMAPEVLVSGVLGMIMPSMLPYGRESDRKSTPPPPKDGET